MSEIVRRYDSEPSSEVLEECFSKDEVKRHSGLHHIVDLIYRIEGAYTLFIDGAWGSGKTYIVKQIVELLRHKNSFLKTELDETILDNFCRTVGIEDAPKSFIPVYFNAWNHDHYDDPLCPLLCEMATQLDASLKTRERDYQGAIVEILDSVLPVNVAGIVARLNGSDILEDFKKRIALREKFDLLVDDTLPTDNERLVLFIDELDRCRPEFAIKLLEQTKQLFSNPKVIVVISTDSVQLGHALAGVYGETFDAKKYLERFYDRKVALGKIDQMEYLELLGYSDHGYRGFEAVVRSLIRGKELTMRDLQKIAPVLIAAQGFAPNYFGPHSPAATFASNGLMPGFIFIAYSNPELWRLVKDANQYQVAYDYLIAFTGIRELLNDALSGFSNNSESVELTEEDRKQFFLDVCTLLFADREFEKTVREARERLGVGSDVRFLRKQVVDFNFD